MNKELFDEIYSALCKEIEKNSDFDVEDIISGRVTNYYVNGINLYDWFYLIKCEIENHRITVSQMSDLKTLGCESLVKKLAPKNYINHKSEVYIGQKFSGNFFDQGTTLEHTKEEVDEKEPKAVDSIDEEKMKTEDLDCFKALQAYIARNPKETYSSIAQKNFPYGDKNLSAWLREKIERVNSDKATRWERETFYFLVKNEPEELDDDELNL